MPAHKKKPKPKISHPPSTSTLKKPLALEVKSELPKYRYFNSIMRNLEEIKLSWGLSSRLNQLRTSKIRTKLSELIQLIKIK